MLSQRPFQPMNSWTLTGMTLAFLLFCAGCKTVGADNDGDSDSKPDSFQHVAQIVSVDRTLEYVALRNLSGVTPESRATLTVYRDGGPIATIRLDGSGNDDYLIADIVDGSPMNGDIVLLTPAEPEDPQN